MSDHQGRMRERNREAADRSEALAVKAERCADRNALKALHARQEGKIAEADRLDALSRQQMASARLHRREKSEFATRAARLERGETWSRQDPHGRGSDTHERGSTRDGAERGSAAGRLMTVKARMEEQRRERERAEAEAARLTEARNVHMPLDDRTAAGSREMAVFKARGTARAELVLYASLITVPSERTAPRLQAMQTFDTLCHSADAGHFPEPRFEMGVDRTRSPGMGPQGISTMSLHEKDRIRFAVGNTGMRILEGRIYHRNTFAALAREGVAKETALPHLFLAALDDLARFYGLFVQGKAAE